MDLLILNFGQLTKTVSELASQSLNFYSLPTHEYRSFYTVGLHRHQDLNPRLDNAGHALTTMNTQGLCSNPGEDMDICKCIVPSRHEGTINSRRAASPLVWLVEREERWEAPDHPQVSSLKIGVETSQIVLSSVWCSKLRIMTVIT
ncbi:uncharacterized protein TNCV_2450731 [Trichonephila clavipes]|nr:uncharacterized protein TNCV_2450731 [Trichonephila clavipes]